MANEKRQLIDANALIEKIRKKEGIVYFTQRAGRTYELCVRILEEFLKKEPAVDAVEVVHGRWEDMWGGKYANPRYRCSVCKEKANYKHVQDELLSWKDVQVLTPYCPYCLAKLEGGIDNDIKTV